MMSQSLSSQDAAGKLDKWCRKILLKAKELISSKEQPHVLSVRYLRFYHEDVDPVLRILSGDPQYQRAAGHLKDLCGGLEDLFLRPTDGPKKRGRILNAVSRAGLALENELRPVKQEERVSGARLRDLAWRTYMNDEGRIIFDAGGGLVVPISDDIRHLAKPEIIAQAIRQQPTYPEEMRPRNMRRQPGALLTLKDARRIIVIGDLHGRYDNLELVLADKDNWRALKEGSAHLVFLGDAIHPRTSKGNQDAANADSFRVMFLIMSLRAENPGNVHYLIGNHENAHIGGQGTAKGETDVQEGFSRFVERNVGPVVLEVYEKFLRRSPVAAKVRIGNGYLLLLHASPSPLVRTEQALINVTVGGRANETLTDVVWSRNFDPKVLRTCLRDLGADIAVCGHTCPSKASERKYGYTCLLDRVFGQAHGVIILLNSQANTFGYLDVGLTQSLPGRIEHLKAPDGNSAFRALRRGR